MTENDTPGVGQAGNGFASKPESTSTRFAELLDDLNGGVFAEQVGRALSDVAAGVVANGDKKKSGKVTITFDFSRIGESNQVAVRHSLAFIRPTTRGKVSEETTTETPLHVGRGGRLTLVPETQGSLDFGTNR